MKKILFCIASAFTFFSVSNAQVKVSVTAGGSPIGGPSPYYSPANITINVGDTVEWKNIQGEHNVDGRTTSYPSNPQTFYSGLPATGWTFSHVFTVPGFYQYKCNKGQHATTQHGTITVNTTTSVLDFTKEEKYYVYPNPVSDLLFLKMPAEKGIHHGTIEVYNATGTQVIRAEALPGMLQELKTDGLSPGLYFLKVLSQGTEITTVKFIKE